MGFFKGLFGKDEDLCKKYRYVNKQNLPKVSNEKETFVMNSETKSEEKAEYKIGEKKDKTNSDKELLIDFEEDSTYGLNFLDKNKKRKFYKPTENVKLIVFLIENSEYTLEHKEQLVKFVKRLANSGQVVFINYGENIKVSNVANISNFSDNEIFNIQNIGKNICLYDSLIELNNITNLNYMKIEEYDIKKILINNIEIIGIGTCRDIGSKISKENAINYFYKTCMHSSLKSKYFCFTESSFIEAAEIGFRSIGAINRKYKV